MYKILSTHTHIFIVYSFFLIEKNSMCFSISLFLSLLVLISSLKEFYDLSRLKSVPFLTAAKKTSAIRRRRTRRKVSSAVHIET